MSKLRVIILEAEGDEACREILANLPRQLAMMDSAPPPVPAVEGHDDPPVQSVKRLPATPHVVPPRALPAANTILPPLAKTRNTNGPNWRLYPVRVAHTRKPACKLCNKPIEIGEAFRDGGMPVNQAHEECLTSSPRLKPGDS